LTFIFVEPNSFIGSSGTDYGYGSVDVDSSDDIYFGGGVTSVNFFGPTIGF